ncbi:MAG: hypothetical protein ACC656_15130, partial [Candidatus Heimdallarchaeota archaeon]
MISWIIGIHLLGPIILRCMMCIIVFLQAARFVIVGCSFCGMTEDELIAKIIYLLNQNLTLAQIARILNIEINFLFRLAKLLKQPHMHKLISTYELELAIQSVKSILNQYAHIINDEVGEDAGIVSILLGRTTANWVRNYNLT